MRIFVGIELSEEARKSLKNAQFKLRPYVERGKFTRSENFHLTLWFFGEIQDNQLRLIQEATRQVALNRGPFELVLGPLGVFQKKKRVILWAGVSQGERALNDLFTDFIDAFGKIGFQVDPRGLNPHITLGRQIKLVDDINSLNAKYPILPTRFIVEHLTIFESKRVNDRLTYVPIDRVHLNG